MVSVKVTVTLVLLYALAVDEFTAYPECCRRYIKGKLRWETIKGYSVQPATEMCPINAIIFHTKMGKVCTDPALNWVIGYVSRIRFEAQKLHQKAQALK
ncbi:C-C motif chemokine 20a.3 [Nothobranchius furzeri]|uniref:C-C motif chemokine n=1 Tax=Nothobranchius furzeri TaxID=105023 RepID=A0A9D2YKT7_NOTFU|nr:C-C motif chemokine 20a.3 [Nothobranchius furzeri]KAF7222689.1 C-C motif chemokine 20-like [Nothobranchius furzeri]